MKASTASHVPFWGHKLATPVFYRDDKYNKFFKQWSQRLELEMIKMKHAIILRPNDVAQRKEMKKEIQNYIQSVYDSQIEDAMKDVYITNHQAKPSKFNTTNEKEDA